MGTEEGPLALVEVAHASDTGRVRHHNEDRALAAPPVLAVADGMGGAQAGEVAAQVAVDEVARLGGEAGAREVRSALERANRTIRRMAREDPDKAGMGTTMSAALLREDRLEVVHVGDSRVYLWRESALTQVTEDHSVVAELVRRGTISAEEAEHHPHRNVITRALGAEDAVVADVVETELHAGDVVLLCSDGLSSYVSAASIAEVLGDSPTLSGAARALVARANAAGGVDNVTVVLGRVGVAVPSGDTAEAPRLDAVGETHAAPIRVLGGVHGHAGAAHSGSTPAPPPQVLERAGRRRSRLVPALAGVLVLLVAIGGGVAWVGSRTYTLETSSQGTVRVDHGLPVSLLGWDLSSPWQDTGVDADAVRQDQPGALASTARGQGEAVELAAGLVWRFGLEQPPLITAPRPATPQKAPEPGNEATPGGTTTP